MTFAATLPIIILETVLAHLAPIFLIGAKSNADATRNAAATMLANYHPRNEKEFRLAANIIMFKFQALEALAQAVQPDTPISRVLRLRSGAVSLSREAERRLAQLRDLGQQPVHALQADPQPQPEPRPGPPLPKHLTWTQAHEQRQRDLRIAASLKRAEAKAASLPPPIAGVRPDASAPT